MKRERERERERVSSYFPPETTEGIRVIFYQYVFRYVTPQICCVRLLLRSVFYVSTYKAKLKKPVSVHLCKQWRYEADLFALKSDLYNLLILIYIPLYTIMTINVDLFYDKL